MEQHNKEDVKKVFGDRFKKYKQDKRHSYKNMAEGTGLSASYLSDLANGSYLPSTETVIRIADFLEIDERKLLDGLEYWIRPKGVFFNSENLRQEDYSVFYEFLENEKQVFLEEKSKKDHLSEEALEMMKDLSKKSSSTISQGKNDGDGKPLKLIRLKRNLLKDSSLDLLGIPKNAALNTAPLESLDDIKNDILYKIVVGNTVYFRKVFIEGEKLILIPYSSDNRFKIVSVDIKDIKAAEKVSHIEFTADQIT